MPDSVQPCGPSRLLCPWDSPGKNIGDDLPHPGIEPMSLTSPAWAGGFFTNSAIWEAPLSRGFSNHYSNSGHHRLALSVLESHTSAMIQNVVFHVCFFCSKCFWHSFMHSNIHSCFWHSLCVISLILTHCCAVFLCVNLLQWNDPSLYVLRLLVISNSLWPHGLQLARLLCPWDFSGKNTRVGCHFLFQKIFLTQELNPCLLRLLPWQVGSLPLVPPSFSSLIDNFTGKV